MSRSKKPSDLPSGYQVGYGKPPVAGQFKKGVSGNPKGRPKGQSLEALKRKVLSRPVTMRDGERRKKVTLSEALLSQQVQRALEGDIEVTREILAMIEEVGETHTPEELTAAQRLRIAIYFDHEEIRDALIEHDYAELNEEGRTKLRPAFLEALFGLDYAKSRDKHISALVNSYLVRTKCRDCERIRWPLDAWSAHRWRSPA